MAKAGLPGKVVGKRESCQLFSPMLAKARPVPWCEKSHQCIVM